ncbi:MAG TPA: hypothetical protein VF174_14210 [Micromonosporaceae bacterium]
MKDLFDRLAAALAVLTRITLIPVLVRAAIFAAVLAAFVFAYPVQVFGNRSGLLLAGVALLPAIGPRRFWPTLAMLIAVAGWLLSTAHEPIALWRLLGLSGALYLAHSLCALAAALPADAVVAPEAVARWVLRAFGVVLGSAALGVLLLHLAGPTRDGSSWAALAGLATAAGTAVLLARLAGGVDRGQN